MPLDIGQLVMKIVEFNRDNRELVVKFSSTNSKVPVDEASASVFQLTMFPEVDNEQEFLRRVAMAGFSVAQHQLMQEQFEQLPAANLDFTKLVNQPIVCTLEETFGTLPAQCQPSISE